MKKNGFLFVISLLLVLNPVFGQKDYKHLYEHKVHTYNRMKHAGWTMTGIGSGFACAGTIMLASVPSDYWGNNNSTDQTENIGDVFQALSGIICLSVGVGLMAGGITLGSIGSHKSKKYQQKLDNLSFGMICTPKRQGFSLTYRF